MIVWRDADIVGIKPHWSLNCIVRRDADCVEGW